jgi:hypothetical protein
MAKAYVKVPVRPLRDLGLDERWLQQRIAEDPSLLGLGNLAVVDRERTMVGGGRLDLLLADIGGKARYEVELMLGQLDESHIIRTIEYWDVERRRFPHLDHKAVIVAEDITSRFLNVISLLNKSVPLVALKMTALDLPDGVGLTFTKVLDLAETFEDGDEDGAETATQVTRKDWEEEGYGEGMAVMDQMLAMLKATGIATRAAYNQDHVAVGGPGKNFLWFAPQKRNGRCLTEFLCGKDGVEAMAAKLSAIGDVNRRKATVKVVLTTDLLAQHKPLITEVMDMSERLAR